VDRGEIDFREIKVFSDDRQLYLMIDLGRETIWQNGSHLPAGNSVRINLKSGEPKARERDPGGSPESRPPGTYGTEFEVHLGARQAFLFRNQEQVALSVNEVGLVVAPTCSSAKFEILLPRSVRPGFQETVPVLVGPEVRFFVEEDVGGDRVPDRGRIDYRLSNEPPPELNPIPLPRFEKQDLRVLCHNVCFTGMANRPEPFQRYLAALQPDIVCFQEVYEWSKEEVAGFLRSVLGGRWYAAGEGECVTASRFPITDQVSLPGSLVTRVELPRDLASAGLLIFNAHSPCCGDNAGREYVHDLMASSLRDLLEGKGLFPVNQRDTILMLGDFNMVGFQHQLRSIRDGDIFDNGRFGPDFSPARDYGSLTAVLPRHTHTRQYYTWRADASPLAPGKLDYVFFSDDTASLKNSFVLWTPEMPEKILEGSGLHKSDSPESSDHLVLVADFEFE
jgi:hypothetical protein